MEQPAQVNQIEEQRRLTLLNRGLLVLGLATMAAGASTVAIDTLVPDSAAADGNPNANGYNGVQSYSGDNHGGYQSTTTTSECPPTTTTYGNQSTTTTTEKATTTTTVPKTTTTIAPTTTSTTGEISSTTTTTVPAAAPTTTTSTTPNVLLKAPATFKAPPSANAPAEQQQLALTGYDAERGTALGATALGTGLILVSVAKRGRIYRFIARKSK